MTIKSVEIYEFSTGIKFDHLANGGWVSRGFTSDYMNCTIDPVPPVVERSISNREFRIAEGTASKDPAVVARVVGEGEESWSVVAIVSRGEDEVGRGGSFYRYFLAQGEDKILHILEWLEKDKEARNLPYLRSFNPLDRVSQSQRIAVEPQIPVVKGKILDELSDDIPIVLENKIPSLSYIHALTLKKVEIEEEKRNYVPIAWAFNIGAVEQINRFTVVRAASENAYNVLKKAKASAAKALPLVLFDEQAVKSAVKGLSNSSSNAIKTEYVTTLAEAFGNKSIDSNHWHRIFDGQGANNALKQKIYTPQMVKLLVIRALAIPATLPEYYDWRAKAGKSKNNNVDGIAQEFEQEFSNKLIELKNKGLFAPIAQNIVEGFGVFISNFLNDDTSTSTKAMVSLLNDRQGLWGSKSAEFIQSFKNDLDKMLVFATNVRPQPRGEVENLSDHLATQPPNRQSSTSIITDNNIHFELKDDSWQNIWEEISPYWQDSRYHLHPKPKYLKFAELFEGIEEYGIALVFYRIGQGILEPGQFKKLTNPNILSSELQKKSSAKIQVYGITIRRKQSSWEKTKQLIFNIFKYLWEDPSINDRRGNTGMKRIESLIIGLGVASLSFMSGVAVGNTNFGRLDWFIKDKETNNSQSRNTENTSSSLPRTDTSNGSDPSINENKKLGDKRLDDLKKKFAEDIVIIYELKKSLETETKKPNALDTYPSLNYSNIGEEILSKFSFDPTQQSKLNRILSSIYSTQSGDIKKEVIELLQSNEWDRSEVEKALIVIKNKSGSELLKRTGGKTIPNIKSEIISNWKKPK